MAAIYIIKTKNGDIHVLFDPVHGWLARVNPDDQFTPLDTLDLEHLEEIVKSKILPYIPSMFKHAVMAVYAAAVNRTNEQI